MKRFLLYLLTVVSIVACSEGEPADNGSDDGGGNTPTTPTITLNKSSVSFDELADEESISFSTTADWIAEIVNDRADGWLSVTPQSGSAGDASITIKAKENDTPDERNASVRIKAGSASKTISVSQKQKDALTVTASKFEVEAEGGEVKIEVKANIDFEYAIDESAKEWIKYEGTRAMKTSTLTFSVAKNDDTDKREGKIAIKSGEFNEVVTIYQAGSEPSIVISQNEYVVSSDGETISVEVSSNVDVAVEMPTDADWISENTTRATSTNTYRFDIQPNEDYDQRTAEIKFTNKENGLSEIVKIVQTQKDALVVAKDSYTVSSEGDQIEIEVGHNVDFDIEISNDWITKAENTRAFVTETLNFNIAKNPTTDNREGTIVFKSKDGKLTQTVKVYQAQEDALIISKKDIVVSDEGGTISFELQTNVEFKVSEPDVDWLRAVTTRGLTTHTLNYTVDANTSYDSREAKIVVTDTKNNKSETITITQTQKDAIVLAKDSYTVSSDGDQIEIEVGHNVDFDIEIANDWITKAQNTRAFVTENIVFNIAKNPTTDNREGTIVFKSKDGKLTQTVKVYQAQEDALIISEKDIIVSDEGGTISFELQTNVDFKVSDPDVDWLRPVTTRGLTTHTLNYTVDTNTSYDSREAHIIVTDTKNNKSETITITQAQKDAIVLAKDSYTVNSDGDQIEIEVGHNVDFDIEISNDWITKAETRAFVTETLVFNIAKNPTYDNREGTIIFKSKDGKLSQTVNVYQGVKTPSANEIWYTGSVNYNTLNNQNLQYRYFGAYIISQEYDEESKTHILKFDRDITSINDSAFGYEYSLTSINLPATVVSIGKNAFTNCEKLVSVNIHDEIKTINDRAFAHCRNLRYISLPEGLINLGNSAFYECSSLVSVILPESLETVGSEAFGRCVSLKTINIPSGIKSLNSSAFLECKSLESFSGKYVTEDGVSVIIDNQLVAVAPFQLSNYIVPEEVTSIGDRVFFEYLDLESVVISNNVVSIGHLAFRGCQNLSNISIGCRVALLGDRVFSGCENLTSIELPNSVVAVGEQSFYDCKKLQTIKLSDNLTTIGELAFANCEALTNIELPNSVVEVGESAFRKCKGLLCVKIGNNVTSLKGNLFYECTNLSEVVVGDSVTNIGEYAFGYCRSLKSVNIPESVKKIGCYAFYDCSQLNTVTILDGVTHIDSQAFRGCRELEDIQLGNSVEEIGYYTFDNCSKLKSIAFPESLKQIYNGAFNKCTSLNSVYFSSITPPRLSDSSVFAANAYGRIIYVPYSSDGSIISAYKSSWSYYSDFIKEYDY